MNKTIKVLKNKTDYLNSIGESFRLCSCQRTDEDGHNISAHEYDYTWSLINQTGEFQILNLEPEEMVHVLNTHYEKETS